MKTCESDSGLEQAAPVPRSVITASPTQTPITNVARRTEGSRFIPVVTLVLWMGCSVVSALGLMMPYAKSLVAEVQAPDLNVEMLNVELSNDPLPELTPSSLPSLATPLPAETVAQPSLPPTIAVAMPSPAIAFALPVEGATRVVEAEQAGYSRAMVNENTSTALPAVQPLTFGVGAGRQPAPEYPLAAQDARQEGVVNVRFVVAANGRVAAAEAVATSPWPLLNESALRTVRQRWRFPAGATRAYEVAIRFVLPK